MIVSEIQYHVAYISLKYSRIDYSSMIQNEKGRYEINKYLIGYLCIIIGHESIRKYRMQEHYLSLNIQSGREMIFLLSG